MCLNGQWWIKKKPLTNCQLIRIIAQVSQPSVHTLCSCPTIEQIHVWNAIWINPKTLGHCRKKSLETICLKILFKGEFGRIKGCFSHFYLVFEHLITEACPNPNINAAPSAQWLGAAGCQRASSLFRAACAAAIKPAGLLALIVHLQTSNLIHPALCSEGLFNRAAMKASLKSLFSFGFVKIRSGW